MSDQKTYINGVFIKEKEFQNGGKILKVSILADKLMEQLAPHKNDKGYVNLIISKRQSPDKNSNTHYVHVDFWKPTPQGNASASQPQQSDDPLA